LQFWWHFGDWTPFHTTPPPRCTGIGTIRAIAAVPNFLTDDFEKVLPLSITEGLNSAENQGKSRLKVAPSARDSKNIESSFKVL
jgi:hypothetical protein